MHTQDFNAQHDTPESGSHEHQCRCGRPDAAAPRLSRKMRLVTKLMRAEMQQTLQAQPAPTRGEVKAAARAIDQHVSEAVSPEELAATLETLDKIAEAFGGRDALPFHPRGHRRGHGRGGFPGHGYGRGHGFRRGFSHHGPAA